MPQSSFGARSTASEVVAGHDLRGKTILITGASSGIGYEAARALLSAHSGVIIAARDPAKGEQAVPYNPEISTLTGYIPYALNAGHAEQLWTIAEQLVEL